MSQDKLNSTDRFVGGLENLDGNYRASGAISAGDAVHFDGTETGNVPDVSVSDTSGEQLAGIAVHDAAGAGDPITLAQTGAEVRANATAGISPGDPVGAEGDGSVNTTDTAGDAVAGVAKTASAGGEVVMLVTLSGDFHG